MGSHRAAGRTLRLEGRSGRREKGSGGFGTTCGLHEQSRSGAVLGTAYTWGQLEPEGWGCVRGWRGQSPEGRHAHWEELGVAQHPGASARGWGCFPSVSLPPWWAGPSSPLLAGGCRQGACPTPSPGDNPVCSCQAGTPLPVVWPEHHFGTAWPCTSAPHSSPCHPLASPRSGTDVPLSRNSSYLVNQSLEGVSDKAIWFSAEPVKGGGRTSAPTPTFLEPRGLGCSPARVLPLLGSCGEERFSRPLVC